MKQLKSKNIGVLGFTFLEVMVALAILSLVLVAIVSVESKAVVLIEKAKDISRLTELTRSKMNELEMEFEGKSFANLKEEDKGDFEDYGIENVEWQYQITKLEIPKGPEFEIGRQTEQSQIGPGVIADILDSSLRQLTLVVTDKNRRNPSVLEISTLLVRSNNLPNLTAGANSVAPSQNSDGDQ